MSPGSSIGSAVLTGPSDRIALSTASILENESCVAMSQLSAGPVIEAIPKTLTAALASTYGRIEDASTPGLRLTWIRGHGSVCACAPKASSAAIGIALIASVILDDAGRSSVDWKDMKKRDQLPSRGGGAMQRKAS